MFEESVESFIVGWRPYAADVTLFAHTEGSPLLECRAGGAIFGVLERTGPYNARSGPAKMILHFVSERVAPAEPGRRLEVVGPSRLKVAGLVVLRQGHTLVVDAGVPLVIGSFAALPDTLAAGDWALAEGLAPVHGFVVPKTARSTLTTVQAEI